MAKTALLIVDMQNDFLLPEAPYHVDGMGIVPAVAKLIAGGRAKGWSIIYIVRAHLPGGEDTEKFRQHMFSDGRGFVVEGSRGARIIDAIKPGPEDIVIQKVRFSAFMATKLDLVLRRLGVSSLVICGLQYPNCIRATAVDGMSLDYDVQICRDATWGATPEVVAANIHDLENMGIPCRSLEDILA